MKLLEQIKQIFSTPFLIGDCEATGGGRDDEMLELSLINTHGSILFDSLFRASKRCSTVAYNVHGITDTDIYYAPHFISMHKYIDFVLASNRLITFNISYDKRMIEQTYYRYNVPYPKNLGESLCLMKIYSDFCGKRKSLEDACKDFGVEPGKHRALSDCYAKLRLLNKLREVLTCQEATKNHRYVQPEQDQCGVGNDCSTNDRGADIKQF